MTNFAVEQRLTTCEAALPVLDELAPALTEAAAGKSSANRVNNAQAAPLRHQILELPTPSSSPRPNADLAI
jgi:hypothetical protein